MTDSIRLRCEYCGNEVAYDRASDPDLPSEVVLIVTNECDKCEAANGGFGEELWFDAEGKVVIPS